MQNLPTVRQPFKPRKCLPQKSRPNVVDRLLEVPPVWIDVPNFAAIELRLLKCALKMAPKVTVPLLRQFALWPRELSPQRCRRKTKEVAAEPDSKGIGGTAEHSRIVGVEGLNAHDVHALRNLAPCHSCGELRETGGLQDGAHARAYLLVHLTAIHISPRRPNDLPFSSERQGRTRAYHGREERRAKPAASRHELRSTVGCGVRLLQRLVSRRSPARIPEATNGRALETD